MAGATKTANVTWKGDLASGSGTITSVGSGAFSNLGVTWKNRTESEDLTSPEELIAAANAACFAMALSHGLAQAGHAPEKLEITAKCTFSLDGGPKISNMDLHVRGTVPGMDRAAFEAAAEGAGNNCPVSTAFKGNVAYTVKAELVG
ncbi:MAG TPA: OsmC family peroxiredoxin [Thermomicrobiales bacterium]|nr:OsmC family peroxiredoxin [Thermomicrobiales bacterium]